MNSESEQTFENAFLLDFFKALSDPLRLQMAGRIADEPAELSVIAAWLDISLRECSRQLAQLVKIGLIREGERYGRRVYLLDERWLRERSSALLDSPRSRAQAGATDERTRVLASFMRNGRLIGIPTGDQRKLVILDEVAHRFESGRTYTEREVNLILKQVYEHDYTTLRRMLVDYTFLNRDRGVYWVGEGRREAREP